MAENDKTPEPTTGAAGAADATDGKQQFRVHKVYLKDVSFESPQSPKVFGSEKKWQPQVSLQLNTEVKELDNDIIENTLNVQVTVKSELSLIHI